MNRRPAGVILSAIVLGFAAFMALIFTAISALSIFLVKNTAGLAASIPGTPPPPNAFLTVLMAIMCLFYLAVAAWAITTLVGLLRLKPWARISVLIIGGCLTFLGLVSAFGTIVSQAVLKNAPPTPGASPHILHVVFIAMAIVWLLVAAVGVAWLIYFNLRSTKSVFAKTTTALPVAPGIPPLDFTYAQQAILTNDLSPTATTTFDAPPATQSDPISMKIIGWLLIAGGTICLLESWLPIPLFFLGMALTGWSSHAFMLIWGLISGYAGYGLVRLKRQGWLLTIAIQVLGALNVTLMFWPAYRARMLQSSMAFSQSINTRMGIPATSAAMAYNTPLMDSIFIVGAVCGDIFFVFLLVLLWRARWAFAPKNTLT